MAVEAVSGMAKGARVGIDEHGGGVDQLKVNKGLSPAVAFSLEPKSLFSFPPPSVENFNINPLFALVPFIQF